MKTIPATFRKNGYNYVLIERTPKAAIYSQTHGRTGNLANYEVVRIRHRKGRSIANRKDGVLTTRTIEEGEFLPSTEEWGRHGWTCAMLDRARERLNTISATPHTNEAPPCSPATSP